MADITDDISAYEKMQEELELNHMGKWVLFHDKSFIAQYDSFEAAAKDATTRFGRGPYLIRQIGMRSITLPASVMFRAVYA
jgi:hypothetical protein